VLRALGIWPRHGKSHGYNIFVLGPSGAGKRSTTTTVLEAASKKRPAPGDWVYVYNFEDAERPIALSLPGGMGETLRKDMEGLIRSLLTEIPRALPARRTRETRPRSSRRHRKTRRGPSVSSR